MDADGLPLVGPGIDYTKVESINQKRTIAFLNHFITHTTSFLNRFSCVCEEKLENLSNRLEQLEITMNLLEAKLLSIPGLENVTAASSSTSTASEGAPASSTSSSAPPPPPSATQAPATSADEGAPPPPPEEEKPSNPVSKDPRYARFFKMLQVGVPEQAVKTKMAAEGFDPSLLDNPDAPAPPEEASKKDDSDDFSDDDDDEDSDDFD